MGPAYDAAKDFMATARAARARGELHPHVSLSARMLDDGLMVVAVQALPDGALNPEVLRDGPAHGRDLFTALGAACWAKLGELAMAAAQGADPGGIAAVILPAEAVDSARERLAALEAKAAA